MLHVKKYFWITKVIKTATNTFRSSLEYTWICWQSLCIATTHRESEYFFVILHLIPLQSMSFNVIYMWIKLYVFQSHSSKLVIKEGELKTFGWSWTFKWEQPLEVNIACKDSFTVLFLVVNNYVKQC